MKIWMLLLSVFITASAFSIPTKEAKELNIVTASGKDIEVVTVAYEGLKPDLTFKATSPHMMLNPERKQSEWKGMGFKNLIGRLGKNLPKETEVTVVAADGYSAQLTIQDLTEPEGMIALYENGKLLEPRRGGPQTMYPNSYANFPKDMLFEGFGVWYTTAMIVGNLPSRISIQNGDKNHSLDLAKLAQPQHKQSRMTTPNCHLKSFLNSSARMEKKVVKISSKSLDEVAAAASLKGKPFSVETHYGKKVPIKNAADWDVIYLWDEKPIESKFGGPVQICQKANAVECIFYVRGLTTL